MRHATARSKRRDSIWTANLRDSTWNAGLHDSTWGAAPDSVGNLRGNSIWD
jgi:hypothetical protein